MKKIQYEQNTFTKYHQVNTPPIDLVYSPLPYHP